jgi:hypothetical protein
VPESLPTRLFAGPSVALGDEAVTGFGPAKARALLYSLAATGPPPSRNPLAGRLWSDAPHTVDSPCLSGRSSSSHRSGSPNTAEMAALCQTVDRYRIVLLCRYRCEPDGACPVMRCYRGSLHGALARERVTRPLTAAGCRLCLHTHRCTDSP